MKKTYLILAIVLFVLTAQAQYIYNDFDANQNEEFSGWPNAPTAIVNPDPSGVNTSANVGEWIRSTEQYAHVYTELDGMIDFSTGEMFYLKVWSPLACDVLFKLEDKNNGNVFVENMQTITTPNQWVQLEFNFTGAASGTYNKIVIFMDFAGTTDNTFYFDDLEGPEYGGGVNPGDPVTLPVTFEDDEVNYALADFGGTFSEIVEDPTEPSNHVAKTIKTDAAEPWAGTTVGGAIGFADPIAFDPEHTVMTVRVWSPDADIPVRLKVENSTEPTISVETEVNTTVAEQWETLSFDFLNEAPGTEPINFDNVYQKASIFFNFGVEGSAVGEKTYYWDDVEFLGPEPKPLLAMDVQDNFEDDGWGTITTWNFQDPDLVDITIIEDPTDPENHILDYVRSGTFEWTNAQFILDHRMDLSERHIFEVRAYFPSSNDYSGDLTPTLALKLQNSLLGGNAWTTQTEVIVETTAYDEWVTLEFDFSEAADREDYDQVVVQFGGEGHFVPGQFHLDDLMLLDNPISISEPQTRKLEIYPNPANDVIHISNINDFAELEIFNITGQSVIQLSEVSQQVQVNKLPEGVYTIVATDIQGNNYNTKLIIR